MRITYKEWKAMKAKAREEARVMDEMARARRGESGTHANSGGGLLSSVLTIVIIGCLSATQISTFAARKESAEKTAREMSEQQIRMYTDIDKARRVIEHKPPMDAKELAELSSKGTAADLSGICIGNGMKLPTFDAMGRPTTRGSAVEKVGAVVADPINCPAV